MAVVVAAVAVTVAARELPLPAVPDSLRTPAARAAYVVGHYWDAMDWADTAALADTAFIEGAFAGFAAVMPHAPAADAASAAAAMMDAAESAGCGRRMADIAARYLGEPSSPVYCSDCLLPLLGRAIARGTATQREMALHDELSALAPGAVAPQLTLVTGPLPAADVPTLLLFYDSACSDCSRLIGRLASDAALAARVAAGSLRVVAVEMDGAAGSSLPAGWVAEAAADPDAVYDTWRLGRLPSMWLIGADGRVVLRDATVPALGAAMAR